MGIGASFYKNSTNARREEKESVYKVSEMIDIKFVWGEMGAGEKGRLSWVVRGKRM